MNDKSSFILKVTLSCCAWSTSGITAQAQETGPRDQPQLLQGVTVTGSRIRRADLETPSPVLVLTADDLARSGYTTVSQVLRDITVNGQGTLSQSFSGSGAIGSSGVALRGLTVGGTLTLIDGHRTAPYPVGDDGQRSFVDISNIPFDAIERVEILKDGSSAIYGSDAIAGVVNIILKRSFVGLRVTADAGTSYKGDGDSHHLAAMWGMGNLSSDGHDFYVTAEFRRQSPIRFSDRGGLFTQTDFTSTGGFDVTQGVPNALNGNLPASGTGYVVDANGNITGFMPGCNARRLATKECTFSNTWALIQPATENYNFTGRFNLRMAAGWQMSLQSTYLESKFQSTGRPDHTFPTGYQGLMSGPGTVPTLLPSLPPTTISSSNPRFPASSGSAGALYYTLLDLGPTVISTDSRSTRTVLELVGDVGQWSLESATGYSEIRLRRVGRNMVNAANLQLALDSMADPYLVGGPNNRSIRDFVAPELGNTSTSKLGFLHLSGNRDLMQLPGGPLRIALGADYMRQSQRYVAPDPVAAGAVEDFDNSFSIGAQTVGSAYGELVAPLTKGFAAEGAIRYDRYNLSGGKWSPKFGAKYVPTTGLAIRGTLGQGFRAPNPSENGNSGGAYAAGNSNDPVLCKDPSNPGAPGNFPSQCVVRFVALQGTDPALKPETSKSYSFGFILEPSSEVTATVDFYWIDVRNQIVISKSQVAVRGTNFTPIAQVQPDGTTALVRPPFAPIAFYKSTYENANRTRTNGADVGLKFHHRFSGVGDFTSDFMMSFIDRYDLTVDDVTYHLAGTHGPINISGDTGNPKTRVRWTNSLSWGATTLSGTLNHVGSFDLTDPSNGVKDCATGLTIGAGASAYAAQLGNGVVPSGVKCKVSAFTTLDLYGRYEWSKRLSLHASILNTFNASAPQDWATYGGSGAPYNPSFHLQGAIGRYLTIGVTYLF